MKMVISLALPKTTAVSDRVDFEKISDAKVGDVSFTYDVGWIDTGYLMLLRLNLISQMYQILREQAPGSCDSETPEKPSVEGLLRERKH